MLRYVLPHLLAGCLAGVVASVGIVATDIGSLRELVLNTQGGWIAFALLTFGLVVTFGSIAMGGAIMAIGGGEDC
nr:hypothetical protein [uncultured Rhodopila sp.]